MLNILIVENPGARELLAEELAFDGHTVITTADGETAKEVAVLHRPDLIILDPFLRGRYRWDLLMAIKKEDPFLPVLIVTDYATNRQDPHLTLADGYLNKESCVPGGYMAELRRKVKIILEETPFPAGAAAAREPRYPFGCAGESDRKDPGSCPMGSFH